jgi:predicted nucleic acid-binding protein
MLIDTSGWLCLIHKDEIEHVASVEMFGSHHRHVTTNYILAEFVPLATVRGLPRKKCLELLKRINSDSSIEIIWVDKTLHSKALDLLLKRRDKTYSLCDAVSFVVMRQMKIADTLSTDRHFEQEGFVKLL